jgi:hypothetical protein
MNEERPCRYCVPPKRYPGCHAVCPEGIRDAKEMLDKKHALAKKKYLRNQAEQYKIIGCTEYNDMKLKKKRG